MNTKRMVEGAMFCALVFVATWISIPVPLIGNVNLGDGILLAGAWYLKGSVGIISCVMGAVLCDFVSGYAIYVPATLCIKTLMGIVAITVPYVFGKKNISDSVLRMISAILAEILMIFGYFIYESFFLGFGIAAISNIPFNIIQGIVAGFVSVMTYRMMCRIHFIENKGQ